MATCPMFGYTKSLVAPPPWDIFISPSPSVVSDSKLMPFKNVKPSVQVAGTRVDLLSVIGFIFVE